MKIKFIDNFTLAGKAIVSPGESFKNEDTYKVSRLLIFLLLVLIVFTGSRLTMMFHDNPTYRDINVEVAVNTVERMQPDMSQEEKDMIREQTEASISSSQNSPLQLIGTIFGSAIWLLLILEMWIILTIFSKFVGGEELSLDEKKHKRSFYLCLYASIPLALSTLGTGLLLQLKDPASVANIITLTEYTRATDLSFSLFGMLTDISLPGVLDTLVKNLTDPLYLWMLAVLIWGGADVFRIKKEKTAILAGIIVLIFSLQSWGMTSLSTMFVS